MKIAELLDQLRTRFPTKSDRILMVENFYKKRKELHICDLDAALILLGMAFHFEVGNTNVFVSNTPELLSAIKDSSYVKLLAPGAFKDDIVTVDREQRQKEIDEEVTQRVAKGAIAKEAYEAILAHELLQPIDVRSLDVTKANFVNVGDKAKIEIHCNRYYSFALSQTRYRLISDIVLTNLGEEPIKDAKLVISSDPGYIEFSDVPVALINPKQPIAITEFDVKPHLDQLMGLLEKVAGTLTVKLIADEETLVSITAEVDFFSYDTWLENALTGSSALFMTPNDVAVQNVVALVGKEMQRLTGDPSLPDYQTGDKNNVVTQLKALYNVLHDEGIAYITSPASYEEVGQKIRLPHDALVHKQGTCIDLALLYATCLEAMGLHPFLVLISGHAFAGAFLDGDLSFPTMAYNDASQALTMSSQEENDIVFVECTCFTAGNKASFEEASESGRMSVVQSVSDPRFEMIDVRRARALGFLPLPINFNDVERAVVDYEVVEQNKTRLARKDYSHKGDKLDLSQATLNKFDVWEKKLLDLSRRNQLISYKVGGHGLQLYFYDMDSLYSAFEKDSGNYHVLLMPIPPSSPFELPSSTEEQYEQINKDFASKNIHLIVRNKSQITSLRFFERERKKSFEETGSNIFYLALGFIQYFETPKSVNPLYAPIVLVPIDLVKQSKDSYCIKGREEPPFLNISILEFFHQEYGVNCDDLLTQIDFEGESLDIDSVLNTVEEKITKVKRASIVRTAALNIFNFSKAVMWADVKYRKAELAKNKVIKSIIEGSYVCDESEQIGESIDDEESSPEDLAMPLPADSSQIIAANDCAQGKSFILQGPPGTGKSQTITNMIVNAIYHGKTVLFVAEKMAALEVVQKRLNQLSLGRFALEAHSAKADKTSLMAQFEERVALGSTVSPKEDYLALAEQLKKERDKLNRVINILHKPGKHFLSFYDAFVNYLDIDEDVPLIQIPDSYMDQLQLNEFHEASRLCDELYGQMLSNGGYSNSPFIFYVDRNYVPGLSKGRLTENLGAYRDRLLAFLSEWKEFAQANSLSIPCTREAIGALYDLLSKYQKYQDCLSSLIGVDLDSLDPHVSEVLSKGKAYMASLEGIRKDFSDKMLDSDWKEGHDLYLSLENAFFLKKASERKKLLKKALAFATNKKACKEKDLPRLYETLTSARENEDFLKKEMAKYRFLFGDPSSYEVRRFDFASFEARYLLSKELVKEYGGILSSNDLVTLLSKIQSFSLKNKQGLLDAIRALKEKESELEGKGFSFAYVSKRGYGPEKLLELTDSCLSKIDYLPSWCSFLLAIEEAKGHGLTFVLERMESGDEQPWNFELIYKKSVFAKIMAASIQGDEEGSFNSVDLKRHVDYYRQLIDKFRDLTIKETAARVSARMPSINDSSPSSSQQGILNKAIKSKCRGKAVRQLFEEIKGILPRLFPVFLMSPISCAQYLSPDMPKFDIVIFDEASQMPTSEAVGAIARGKSLVVVGDSKQMPPTSFFQSKDSDDLDSDLSDQESILDDCDVIGLPSRYLNWHYRSKHESLIRFSNAKFYGNRLITFPSPNDLTTKVRFVNAKGVYGEKGATNAIEAKAVVKEIARRLESPELRKRSIGVVTFSSVQQEMVEDLLQDYFASHKEIEKINFESKEPLIVKNLENIQGDERDVILFSVCYGPDKKGNFYYRFGPINMQGGEKRLNVAVSRARYEMIVFASFEPECLASMRTSSRGAQELYSFLHYAKDGSDALTLPNGNAIESRIGFEKDLAKRLEGEGFKVKTDVGKSTFRVDIGIIDPDDEGEYILGVLCDSYSYESALTSKDRNVVQPSVLDGLGWNLIRVWSFDYLDNPSRVVETIKERVEDIRLHPENYKHAAKQEVKPVEFEQQEVARVNYGKPYAPYTRVYASVSYQFDAINAKRQIVREIMNLEAPISDELLQKRYANAIGLARAGKKSQDELSGFLTDIKAKKNRNFSKTKTFYWRENQCEGGKAIALESYRYDLANSRPFEDTPKEEILVAVKEVLNNDGAMFKEELKRCVAKLFRIKTLVKKADATISDCLDYYLSKGELVMIDNDSRIALKGTEK